MKLDIRNLEIRLLRRKIFDNFHLSISSCSRLRRRSFVSLEDFRTFSASDDTRIESTREKFSILKKDKIISSLETNFPTRIRVCFCRMTRVELPERGQQRLRSRISNLIVQFQCEHARFVFPT